MASLLTGVSNSTLAFSSNSFRVHLQCPSGTGPQAISISFASALPSTFRLALSELTLRFNCKRLSTPLVQYDLTVLLIVAMQEPVTVAISSYSYV